MNEWFMKTDGSLAGANAICVLLLNERRKKKKMLAEQKLISLGPYLPKNTPQ